VFCGVLILMIWFFMSFALPQPQSFAEFAELALVTQLVVIATPALIMSVMLTTSPRKTLLLNRPAWGTVPAALGLAICVHPLAAALQMAVTRLYPVDSRVAEHLTGLLQGEHPLWQLLLVFAIAPAIAEELAFRGFVLSGFRHMGSKWRAIVLSSVLFGMTHGIFQQSLVAMLLGIIIGYIAVQSGSIFPCMLFHMVHNGMRISMGVFSDYLTPELIERTPVLGWFVSNSEANGLTYDVPTLLLAALATAGIAYWFHRQPYAATQEEQLQQAIRHHTLPASLA
jgi:sodium transport system permease protein